MVKWRRNLLLPLLIVLGVLIILFSRSLFNFSGQHSLTGKATVHDSEWKAPDTSLLAATINGRQVLYGRDLIRNTSRYFGPRGSIAAITNGMNCQNCHMDAGAKPNGNCFAAVAANYPQFRSRSGIIETISYRVNDCLQRSLNGQPIDSNSAEMQAMVAYLKWLGQNVPKRTKPPGSGVPEIPYLQRAADSAKGARVYVAKCQRCHGGSGEGILKFDSTGYIYPPLWGNHSYNTAAGLYRLSRFADYVRYNMPYDRSSDPAGSLNDEEAWDVAAFVNSQSRPVRLFAGDWPDIKQKAIDYPYGPFADSFPAVQHKYGPFGPIAKARQSLAKK